MHFKNNILGKDVDKKLYHRDITLEENDGDQEKTIPNFKLMSEFQNAVVPYDLLNHDKWYESFAFFIDKFIEQRINIVKEWAKNQMPADEEFK